MKVSRTGQLAGLVLTGAVALTACGSDNGSSTVSGGGSPSASAVDCKPGSLTGAGSTAQKNAMDEWVKQYQGACSGVTVNYQGVGSGAGIQQFVSATVDFAGSDSALKPEEQPKADARCGAGGRAINLPMVVGPIAVAYNVQGVDTLVLDAPTIARIFAGSITKWDDAAIKKLNPNAQLPPTGIQAFHRSDSSGTTDNFTKYLKAASGGAWTYDAAKEWKAPGGQGAKGSDGVAVGVKQTDGGIGYMEQSFVENAGLKAAQIDTGSGKAVALSGDAAAKAVEAAQVTGTGNDLALKIDYATRAAGAYPIVLVTYEIVCEKGTPADKLALLRSFLGYTSSADGQKAIANAGYAPLPSSLVARVQTSVKALA